MSATDMPFPSQVEHQTLGKIYILKWVEHQCTRFLLTLVQFNNIEMLMQDTTLTLHKTYFFGDSI